MVRPWTTSMRNPSTPRSIQKRRVLCMAAATSGLRQFRSGWVGRNRCRYHWPVASSQLHASPPKAAFQLLGLVVGSPSTQMYQSRLGLSRPDRDSTNHGCWSEVWFGTQSTITWMPRWCASARRRSKSARVPNSGSTSQ
ncbi:MAG TPA: hypothetical protein VM388_01940 [Acidimicrobiales bacterium]|nr:hypothetical protein [Acidimicrobiales bacterium]